MTKLSFKTIIILCLLIIMTASLVKSNDDYFRKLGDGCKENLTFESCDSHCEWILVGSTISKICSSAHGWIYNKETEKCEKGDYVLSTTQHPIYYTCNSFDCNDFGKNPLDYDSEHLIYLYNLCDEFGFKNLDNPLSKKGILYCEDKDNDGYGTNCNTQPCKGCKKATELKTLDTDCDDYNEKINPDSIWIIDHDNDGRWGDVIFQCYQKNKEWNLVAEYPDPNLFDCDDYNPKNPEFPIGCYCDPNDVGKNIENSICYNELDEKGTILKETKTNFKIERFYTGFILDKPTKKIDFNNKEIFCPKKTCGLINSKNEKICANPESSWNEYGDIDIKGGNNYCVLENNNATWSSKSNEINALFMTMGDLSEKDYVIYCDDLDNIIHTTQESKANKEYDFLSTFRENSIKDSSFFGKGCVFVINTPYNNNKDYSPTILEGIKPNSESQKVILGLSLNEKEIKNNYFGIDFTQRMKKGDWVFGKKNNKFNGLIYNTDSNILLIVQTKEGNIDPLLKKLIDEIINPNEINTNLKTILLNPLKFITNLFNSNKYNIEKYKKVTFNNFGKSYLGMNNNMFFYSVLDRNNLISKIVNPDPEMKEFLNNLCNNKIYDKNDFRCSGVNKKIIDNVVGITSDLSSLDPDEKEDLWRRFSRQIRLQGNSGGSSHFRDKECTNNDLTKCEPKTCYQVKSCLKSGICNYAPITKCIDNDGCCPEKCTYEKNDNDCKPKKYINKKISSEIRHSLACLSNETLMLRLSYPTNAHVEDPKVKVDESNSYKHFNYLLCISSKEGNFEFNIRNKCLNDEETIISLIRPYNSHIGSSDKYEYKLCGKHSNYNLDCIIGDKKTCENYNIIGSITDKEEAHFGNKNSYPLKICCRFY